MHYKPGRPAHSESDSETESTSSEDVSDSSPPSYTSDVINPIRPRPPVLIRVPIVSLRRARARDAPSARAMMRVRAMTPVTARSHPPRRRLRREIRWAGRVLMVATPLALAAVLLLKVPHSPHEESPGPRRVPAVSLSIETSVLSPAAVREPAVMFPDYLLPGHPGEDVVHAGG